MADGRGGFGFLAALALCGLAGCDGPGPARPGPTGGRVWVFADSAVVEVATGPTEHRWRWNEPTGDTLVALQYAWWARPDGGEPHAVGVFQYRWPDGADREDEFSRLLEEARTCVCTPPAPGRGITSGVPGLEDAAVVSRVRYGRLHMVVKDRRALRRLFAGRPDSVTVYRALPWPRVDSARVPVAYEAKALEEWNVEQGERPDGP
jgi:hypothetical protein